jgi:subtilisin family serine protease
MARAARRAVLASITSAALLLAALQPAALLAASPSAAPVHPDAPTTVNLIVRYQDRPGRGEERRIERLGGTVRQRLGLVDGLSVELPRGQVKRLQADPAVASVEVDGKLSLFEHAAATGDHEYENAWGVEHIGTRRAHLAGHTGQGVKLAIIDTGIDYIHDDPDDTPYVVDPEFLGNYAGGYDFYNGDDDPYDDNGHGTHVAGIAAAEKNGYLVVGVAPDVDLYALKILNAAGEGEYSHLIAALGWAVANDMDVVNMSLGGHEPSDALRDAVSAAYAAGVTMVGASGNINPLVWQELLYGCPVVYPAAYPEVIAVSFTGSDDRLTGYSCTGPQVTIAAPGDQIYSTVPIGSCMFCTPYGYSAQSGTSMASPHVAGVAALLLGAGIPDADGDGRLADDVQAHLCETASPAAGMATTDPRYPNWYGCGIVHAGRALVDEPPGGGGGGDDNLPPSAVPDEATVAEDATVDIAVLANDSDPDGGTLTVTTVTAPTNGTASVNPDGTVRYAPAPDYAGPDSFDYTIADPDGATSSATVSVTVTPVNDDPVAGNDTLSTPRDTAAVLDVLANDADIDGDQLTVSAVGAAGHGATSIEQDGRVRYVPAPGYVGGDTFDYTVSDGAGGTDTGTVTVTVTAVNDPPTAAPTSVTTPYGTPVTIGLAGTDAESCELGFEIVTAPTHGSLGSPVAAACVSGSPNSDSATIAYTPAAGYSGPDAFTYRTLDGSLFSPAATVTITVGAPTLGIHVADLDGSASAKGKNWSARVTILVHGATHAATRSATVTGTWSNGATGTASCSTGRNGTCQVTSSALPRTTASATFTVTGITASGGTYTPAANHDPDGDSDGTVIVVSGP